MMMSMTNGLWTNSARIACAAGAMVALAACGGVREELGLTKNAPDEFAVVTKAPLVMPPDYSLRPPQPGAPAGREPSTSEQARQALMGDTAAATTDTQGQQDLLAAAGADKADPDIRAKVAGENRELSQKSQSFSDQILFWQQTGQQAPVATTAALSPVAQPATAQPVTGEIDPATGQPMAGAPVTPAAPAAAVPAIDPITGQPQVPAEPTPAPEPVSTPAPPPAQPAQEEGGWFDWF